MALADRPSAAQYGQDQRLLMALRDQEQSDAGLILCCRLIMRYENTGPGSQELARAAQAQLEAWRLDRRKAFLAARRLWATGYRPQIDASSPVGSGADVAAAA